MKSIYYWTIIEKEISELVDAFSSVFQTNNYSRDYENVWEWIEGYSKHLTAHINISREHNWEIGEYDKPLQIKISYDDGIEIDEYLIDSIGNELSKHLMKDIIFGDIEYVQENTYQFIERKKYAWKRN